MTTILKRTEYLPDLNKHTNFIKPEIEVKLVKVQF